MGSATSQISGRGLSSARGRVSEPPAWRVFSHITTEMYLPGFWDSGTFSALPHTGRSFGKSILSLSICGPGGIGHAWWLACWDLWAGCLQGIHQHGDHRFKQCPEQLTGRSQRVEAHAHVVAYIRPCGGVSLYLDGLELQNSDPDLKYSDPIARIRTICNRAH